MAELIISSKDNQYVKLARGLAAKKLRDSSGLFLAEGAANIREALRADAMAEPQALLYAAGCESREAQAALLAEAAGRDIRLLAVKPGLMEAVSQTESSQGLALILKRPQMDAGRFAELAAGRAVAVLDGLQDPGNVGTILRTAWAAGLGGAILTGASADIYAPKVVRAAMGAIYHLPALALADEEAWELVRSLGCELICADAAGEDFRRCRFDAMPPAWLLGREAAGPSAFWRERAARRVAIPMRAGVDSLNVAVAAGILFFSATK